MDSSLATVLISNAGIAGVVVILICLKVLTPGWYAKKLEQQNEILAATADRAVSELAVANQLIGELRALAYQRTGHLAVPPGEGTAGETPVAQEA